MVSTGGEQPRNRLGRRSLCLAALLTVAALVGSAFLTSAASAQRAHAKPTKPTVVVKEVNNATYGEILTTKKKRALYTFDQGTCSAATDCSTTIWPPLLMPAGKTVPGGATGLGTVAYGSGQLQVTYHGQPLYTFYQDTKKKVTGDGIGGFTVAHVTA